MITTTTRKSVLLPSLLAVAGLMASIVPVSVQAATGDVFVSAPPQVVRVGLDGSKITLPSTILTPSGSVADQEGNLYVADRLTGSVVKIDSDGNQTTVATGLNNPGDLALDGMGNLFVANTGTNAVLKIAPNGTKTTVATGLKGPQGVAVDALGNLFVSNSADNTIVKIGTNGTKSTFVSAGLNSPGGLAFDAEGNLLVADSGSNTIVKIAPDGTTSTVASGTLNSPEDVAVDGLGNILVADTGSNSILKIAPNGTTTALTRGVSSPMYVTQTQSIHQLLDIATRGFVEAGDHALIGGFIVRGTPEAGLGQTTVVVRALGPSLSSAGINDPLKNPVLEIRNSKGALVAKNDNWKNGQKSQVQSTGLAPKNDKESAIYITLPDGNFTAIVTGAGGGNGVALVEVFKVQ